MGYFDGIKVAVASHSPAAAFAGWLLRTYGADVRHRSALDPAGVGAFLAEGGEAGVDPGLDPGDAEILLTDAPVTAANREALEDLAARVRVVWITPWGVDGPLAEHPATALTLQAAGGWMSAVGDPGEEPLGPPGDQCLHVVGLFGAIAAASGQLPGRTPAPGLSVVSAAEAVTATMIYDTVAFQYYGRVRERFGNRFAATQPTLVTLPTADGFLGLHAALHAQWVRLCDVIGKPDAPQDPRFATSPLRSEHLPELDAEVLLPWFNRTRRWDAYHTLQAAGIPCAPIPDLAEVLASPQLFARDAWREIDIDGRRVRVPGPPARESALGGARPARRDDPRWRPGALRVVELSMGWAGPLAGYALAALGADVMKVEGPERFDWWRGSRAPGEDTQKLYERSHVFNSANRGKRGVAIDFTTPEGREAVLDLVASADVVLENFGAGVMERNGFDYEVLAARNPGIVLVRQPAFGADGPEASYRAFGNTIEGMSGLTSMMGYRDGPPVMMSNALGDPVSGLQATLATIAALHARERDGRGRCVEVAQLEGFLPLVSAELIACQQSGLSPVRNGNRRAGSALSGVFRCAGDDAWAAVEARTEDECRRLFEVLGIGDVPASADEREQVARTAVAARDRDELVEALLQAGVPAAPINSEPDLLASEMLQAAGFFQPVEREYVGMHLYPSLPVLEDGERWLTELPAPCLGEHNAQLLGAPLETG